MRNEFIQHPAGNVIVEVDRLFGIRDGIIRIGVEESKAVISGAENILILSGRGSGTNRVYDSIKNAMLNAYSTAPGYDLFSASKVIVQIIYPANNELLFLEIGDMPQFAEKFLSKTEFLFGIIEHRTTKNSEVISNIIAKNVKKYVNV